MKSVLVYKPELLPYSETFIREQVVSLERWNGILVGEVRLLRGLPLDGMECVTAIQSPYSATLMQRFKKNILRSIGYSTYINYLNTRDLKVKIVHVHFATSIFKAWPLAKRLKVPMVVTLHGIDINIKKEWWESGRAGFLNRRYPAKILRIAREKNVSFIAVSEAIKNSAVKFGIDENKITVCYTGVDTEKFTPSGECISARSKRILFIGRLVEKKGVEYLIKAFIRACEVDPSLELVIIGDGPLGESLKKISASQNIIFLGQQSPENIISEFQRSRILCLPSVTAENGDAEGFGMVLLEAQACGVPVITSALGGGQEGLIEGVTGLSFDEKDIDTLTSHILCLIGDDERLKAMSKSAREFVETQFSLDNCTRLIEANYDRVVESAQ